MARKQPVSSAQSPQVDVLLGPSHSGKTQGLIDDYLDVLRATPTLGPDRALWLAPSSRSVRAVRDLALLAGLDACLAPGIMTFDSLADAILLAANDRSRRLTPIMQRDLLRQVVASAVRDGNLKHYAGAATRPGFVDMLVEHIRELKRYEITPQAYERIAASRGQSPRQRELAQLYTDYERQLQSHGLADRESVQIAACNALANGECRRFQQLDLIVADAFTDFTPAQHELMRLLAGRAHRLCITLPDDAQQPIPTRTDLFAKSAATIAELQRRYPQLTTHHFQSRSTSWPTIDYLATAVFRHPKIAPPTEAIAGLARIEIIEAAGAHDEIVQLARRVKERLSQSKPSDIVVVFRSIDAVAPRIEEVFQRFGIPYAIETSQSIAGSPLFRTMQVILQLDQEDWPFRHMVSVLTNQTITAFDDESRTAADWLVRELQIASSRYELFEVITRLAAQKESADILSEHQKKRVLAAATALPAIARIVTALDKFPQKATLREWTAALTTLADSLAGPLLKSESAAWQFITGHLAALERLDAWQTQPPRALSRSDLLAALVDIADREALPRSFDEAGRVRVLSAPAARAVPARHLFLAGMSEQSFPAPDRAGRLATTTDYHFLHNAAHQKSTAQPASAQPTASRTGRDAPVLRAARPGQGIAHHQLPRSRRESAGAAAEPVCRRARTNARRSCQADSPHTAAFVADTAGSGSLGCRLAPSSRRHGSGRRRPPPAGPPVLIRRNAAPRANPSMRACESSMPAHAATHSAQAKAC